MAKRSSRTVATTTTAEAEAGPRRMGDAVVNADAVYRVPSIHPNADGPWKMEAEKVAWTDAATGLQCIVRRAKDTGHLCGYVAVPATHPVYGWAADAIRQLGVHAHGTVSYAQECQHYEHESVSVCHPTAEDRARERALRKRFRDHMDQARHDEFWWTGFSCDQVYDLVPNPARHFHQDSVTAGTVDRAYRDEGYVRQQCESLAAQLKAIADGTPLPRPAESPPLGLDPRKAQVN